MGELGGFLKIHRVGFDKRDPKQRVTDYEPYFGLQDEPELRRQGARCMDCGVPFCHEGCPLGNLIPDWNDLVYRGKWHEAIVQLHATNNFPEFTGRICPAPCESACVLAVNDDPVDDRADRDGHCRARVLRGLGCAGASGTEVPARASAWWARVRRAWPWPPSSIALGTS